MKALLSATILMLAAGCAALPFSLQLPRPEGDAWWKSDPSYRPQDFQSPTPTKKQVERHKSGGCGQKCAARRAVRELEGKQSDRRK